METKICRTCKVEKPESGYDTQRCYRAGKWHTYRRRTCRTCRYPGIRQRVKKRMYGIDAAALDEMVKLHNGVCAICQQKCKSGKDLCLDHDHQTNQPRGLLCNFHNRAIGALGDTVESISRILKYLELKLTPWQLQTYHRRRPFWSLLGGFVEQRGNPVGSDDSEKCQN